MAKPHVHAQSSARKFGGKMHDYLEIHELLDSSKIAIADNRHRSLTHNSWFIFHIVPKIFGSVITNSDGNLVAVSDVAEQHVLEDFGGKYIPTAEDFLSQMNYQDWMQNGKGHPQSYEKIAQRDRESAMKLS